MGIIDEVVRVVENEKKWKPTVEHMTKELILCMKQAGEINAILEISPSDMSPFDDSMRIGSEFLSVLPRDRNWENFLDIYHDIKYQVKFLLGGESERGKKVKRIWERIRIAKHPEVAIIMRKRNHGA